MAVTAEDRELGRYVARLAPRRPWAFILLAFWRVRFARTQSREELSDILSLTYGFVGADRIVGEVASGETHFRAFDLRGPGSKLNGTLLIRYDPEKDAGSVLHLRGIHL